MPMELDTSGTVCFTVTAMVMKVYNKQKGLFSQSITSTLLYTADSLSDYYGFLCNGLSGDSLTNISGFHLIFTSVFYILIFLVGVMGNGLVLFILTRHRRLRSNTDNILVHLAIADILMLTTFPFSVVEALAGWVFGNYLCKLAGFISRLNFYCSSLLLGCISVERYLSIIHAIDAFRKQSLVNVHVHCLCVWLFCFLLSLPNLFIMGTQEVDNYTVCTYSEIHFPSNGWWQAGRFFTHVVGFLCPLIIMSFCYAHIVATLCTSPRPEKKRAVRVAIVITGVFFLCWTPYNVVIIVDTLERLEYIGCINENHLYLTIAITELLGYVHCCLNPILYAFVGVKFRRDAMRILKHMFRCTKISNTVNKQRKGSTIESESGTIMSSF
ncbi:C-X-C chemokine receptor type 5 [Gastrophryne carolinensis]